MYVYIYICIYIYYSKAIVQDTHMYIYTFMNTHKHTHTSGQKPRHLWPMCCLSGGWATVQDTHMFTAHTSTHTHTHTSGQPEAAAPLAFVLSLRGKATVHETNKMLEQALEMELEERGHGDADTLAALAKGLMQVGEEDRIHTYIHTYLHACMHTYWQECASYRPQHTHTHTHTRTYTYI
jgi:hypothetical protein